jgi:hypothetical protein
MNNINDYQASPGAFIKNGQTKKYKWVLKADNDLAYISPEWHFDIKLTRWVRGINLGSHILDKQKRGVKSILTSIGIERNGDTWIIGGPQDERLTINDDNLSPHSYLLYGVRVIELLTPEQVSMLVNNIIDEKNNPSE